MSDFKEYIDKVRKLYQKLNYIKEYDSYELDETLGFSNRDI